MRKNKGKKIGKEDFPRNGLRCLRYGGAASLRDPVYPPLISWTISIGFSWFSH